MFAFLPVQSGLKWLKTLEKQTECLESMARYGVLEMAPRGIIAPEDQLLHRNWRAQVTNILLYPVNVMLFECLRNLLKTNRCIE